MKKKLNLGCGKDVRENYVNVDRLKSRGIDIVHNLDKFPYPFKDNQFEEILALDILEHLNEPDKCIREIWRISKNKCKIKITVPHYSSVNAWGDLTHKRPFSEHSLVHFDVDSEKGNSLEFYQKEKFKVRVKRIFPKLYKFFGIGFLIKKFPKIYERFFVYIFPIQGLEFYLEVVK